LGGVASGEQQHESQGGYDMQPHCIASYVGRHIRIRPFQSYPESRRQSKADDGFRGINNNRARGVGPQPAAPAWRGSRDGDAVVEVHILDRMKDLDALIHGLLKSLSSCDQAHPAGALVDDGGPNGLLKVVLARATARIDEATSAHVAVRHLV